MVCGQIRSADAGAWRGTARRKSISTTETIYNRPFLRCLHGYGLCLWRFGKYSEALLAFERILSLNPNDNQGVRFHLDEVRHGRSWEEMGTSVAAARGERV